MNMKVSICLLLILAIAAMIEAVRKEEKPGECPRILRNRKPVGKRCRKDKDCANADKCCFAGLRKVCTTPLFPATTPQPKLTTTKQAYVTGSKYQSSYNKGKCPYVRPNTKGPRRDLCRRDSECGRGRKCCMGSNGLECLNATF
ncbi:WAP four-disulfide core domain protein 2 [Trichinella pseudospiralis]|uniref:WAP four-disulfide core domain protein 2 n=2 Tax=Trichinella pseudospiralis TaxID=6337 RepID=A0A0V1FB28_TRIPS|nr:WAP four-disulfide core domain protein 2 [Trichinella pseudospiralis]KRY83325.1 WAP four-disulfide core domain protein 2 [Trichinella pseudospiralis]KRZ34323.1 WAP four-disulfide core domain protein 2 [Trichinella pseudospiralis]KRZ45745.1 WAP four-disulfide core domain protein 2 [Trichinella pseudospiralis]